MTDSGGFEQLTAKAARVQRALASVRGRARSEGGEVRIEVGVDGRIFELVLGEGIATADLIVRAHASALEEATRAAAEIKRELLEDPRVARLVEQTVAQRETPVPHTSAKDGPGPLPLPEPPEERHVAAEPVQPSSIYDRW